MSKKFAQKTVGKLTVWAIVSAVILLASIIVMIFAGFNNHILTDSYKTVTVSVQMSSAEYKTEAENIEKICNDAFEEAGMDVVYVSRNKVSTNSHELFYIFGQATKFGTIQETLQSKFSAVAEYEDNFVKVVAHTDSVVEKLPDGYLLRGVLAGVVIAVLAFAYVALRHKIWNGIVAFVATGLSAALSCAVILATRIPITTTVLYAVEFSMLLTAVLVLFTVSKIRKAEKEANEPIATVETVAENVAFKSSLALCISLLCVFAVLAIVGIFAAENFLAFAAISIVAVLVSAFSAIVFAPALYLPIRKLFAAWAEKRARYDYKKGGKGGKQQKSVKQDTPAQTPAPVEETAETAEEAAEETPVEETSEAAEEAVEEAPVEETAEEAVEEAPAEAATEEETDQQE
ncbi:MAG: hypothetical protein IJX98_02480 [Clostridia bacterium]|nr:hypothetical protein [Clostridia bacterium]